MTWVKSMEDLISRLAHVSAVELPSWVPGDPSRKRSLESTGDMDQ